MLRARSYFLLILLVSFSSVSAQNINELESQRNEVDLRNQKSIEIQTCKYKIGGSVTWHDDNFQLDSDLIILIGGSGAMGRDESISGFKPFRVLASELAGEGYSTFRYDDRGVGTSTGEPDATLQDLAGDVLQIVQYFRTQDIYGIDNIYLLGHSQGAIVAYIAASNLDVAGVISMAGPVLPGDKIINQQILDISEQQGVPDSVVKENIEFQKKLYTTVKNGSGWEKLEEDLEDRLWEQMESLPQQSMTTLGTPQEFVEKQVRRQLESAKSDWFRSFITTDPLSELSKLNIPVLALFGEKDSQVSAGANREALREFFDSHTPEIQIITIPNANHLFQDAITGFPDEYANLDKSFSREFIDTVIQWLDEQE